MQGTQIIEKCLVNNITETSGINYILCNSGYPTVTFNMLSVQKVVAKAVSDAAVSLAMHVSSGPEKI